ncbi:MAG: transcription antitermination factor NusB [Nitrospirota bacterium]
MGLRRQARELALQVLFQHDILQRHAPQAQHAPSNIDLPPEAKPFVDQLVQGVLANLPELDALISRFAEHWSVERMAVVDRNILRCALYELLYLTDIPAKVTINEAIEIAKRYGSEESGAFVNGILDRIVKSDERLQTKRMATA